MKKGEKYVWTVEKTAEFLKRWHEKESLLGLAIYFGCGKNAVANHASRLGLEPRPKGKPPGSVTTGYNEIDRRRRPEARAAIFAALIDTGFPTYGRKSEPLLNCSWIVSDAKPALYCDVRVARGKSYCAEHSAVVYVDSQSY